jgi:L-threonylcarbamoyladenylate synthase
MARIYRSTQENIEKAAGIIRAGGIVSFPTETVYGLGADVFSTAGVLKIFEAKNRPFFDPLIAHISSLEQLKDLADHVSERAVELARAFWPGPLTLVLPRRASVPDIVTSGLDTVAVRMPRHPVALELIDRSGTAIAAPSANPFGRLSPTRAEHVLEGLGGALEMILDGGPCEVGVESTIIKLEADRAFLLRPGGVALEELERIVGAVETAGAGKLTEAPGQLPYHYSPAKPVRIFNSLSEMDLTAADTAFLLFRDHGTAVPESLNPERIAVLSPSGDLREAAANIFSCLHRLDRLTVKKIIAEAVPEKGLGRAIMDRLRKASQKPMEDEQ